jgi:hypothetical protein
MTFRMRSAIAAGALLLLSACSAGQDAETSNIVPDVPGVDVTAGPVQMQDLLVPYAADGYPAGADVPLIIRLFNTAEQTVELREVTPGAGATVNAAASTEPALTVAPRSVKVAGGGRLPLAVAAQECLLLVPPAGPYVLAEGLTQPLNYGSSVAVRFSFSTGDTVTADVPMAPPDFATVAPLGASAGPDLCQSGP